MWNFKKKLHHLPQIDDPVFRRMALDRGIWTYTPDNGAQGFMVTVAAPASGPSDLQRSHFQQIRSNLSMVQGQALAFIKPHVPPAIDVARLSIYSVEVGTDNDSRCDRFSVEFSDEDATTIHRVLFESGHPMKYECDD